MAHDAPAAGHFGRYRTTHLVSREFWWPRLKADVARYVAGCDVCRRAKGPTGRPPAYFSHCQFHRALGTQFRWTL
ncbi:Hypothetical predicted protein [Podarcis lilfordi]|nr:Hypothetical predicted protein [Podarcis lilfordi]